MNSKLTINSTQIPNIIFDEWMKILTPAEFKVVMAIARKTYGWQKDSDRLSYSQIIFETGYEKEAVSTALKSLRLAGKIIVTDDSGNQMFTKEECRGKSLHYKLNLFENRTSKIEHTKETNTKSISLSKDKRNTGDKSPGKLVKEKYGKETNYQNPNVYQIIQAHQKLTGLAKPTDKDPGRVAWNFHQLYGAENYEPCLAYLQKKWKNRDLELNSILSVKRNYPIYQRDVLGVKIKDLPLTPEQRELEAVFGRKVVPR